MLPTKELSVASHGVGAPLPDGGGGSAEGGGGPGGRRLGGRRGAYMGDGEFARARPPGGVTGVLGCQVDPFAFAMPGDVRLAAEQVGAAGGSGEGGARSAVPGAGEDAPRARGAQPVGLDVGEGRGGGEGEAAVVDDLPVGSGRKSRTSPGKPVSGRPGNRAASGRGRPARGPGSARAGWARRTRGRTRRRADPRGGRRPVERSRDRGRPACGGGIRTALSRAGPVCRCNSANVPNPASTHTPAPPARRR